MLQRVVQCLLRRVFVPREMTGIDMAYRATGDDLAPAASIGDVVCCGPVLPRSAPWPAQVVAGMMDGRIVLLERSRPVLGVAWAAPVKFIVKG
jgi:hypothetical protein